MRGKGEEGKRPDDPIDPIDQVTWHWDKVEGDSTGKASGEAIAGIFAICAIVLMVAGTIKLITVWFF